jgi:hypothetical protein
VLCWERIELNEAETARPTVRTLGITLLLNLVSTTKPIQCHIGLVVEAKFNRFAIRVPSNRIANRMLDCIATVHCSKLYSSGKSQWNFLSFESRFGVRC